MIPTGSRLGLIVPGQPTTPPLKGCEQNAKKSFATLPARTASHRPAATETFQLSAIYRHAERIILPNIAHPVWSEVCLRSSPSVQGGSDEQALDCRAGLAGGRNVLTEYCGAEWI